MTRPIFVGLRLSKDENRALMLWANSEGIDKSVLIRRTFRLALRKAPHNIFPPKILESLNISTEAGQ